jgi:protein SCO1
MASIDRRTCLAMVGAGVFSTVLTRRGDTQSRPSSSREAIRARYFPNVVLRTHENREVRFYDDLVKDKIVMINFMYATCEGICPGIVLNLRKVQKLLGNRMGRDIFMYSITLKPREDTPAVLKQYTVMHNVGGPGWLFLTGDPGNIELLRRKLGFVDPDPARDADTSNHIGNIRYGNEPLQLWGACPGLAAPSWIVESLGWVDRRGKPAV